MTTSPNSPREHEASIFSRSPSPLPVLLALAIATFLLAISPYCSSSLTFNYFYQKTLLQSTSRSYTSQYWLQVVLIIVVLFGVIISWLSFKNRARGSNFYEDGGIKLWWRSWSPQVGWFRRSELAPSHTLAAAEVADHVPPSCSPLQVLPASELLSRRQSRAAPLLALPAPPSPSSSVVPMPSLSSSLVPSGLSLPTSSPPASSPTQNSSPSRAASSPPPAHSSPSALATAPATLTTC